MDAPVHVLVAFACQNGSTAGIAETIATELRAAGFAADCRPVAAVTDLAPYDALVLGSGVFLVRRQSDGGGFLAGHVAELADRAVWLFSAGPIGGVDAAPADGRAGDEPAVVRVAEAIGARGAARFGTSTLRVAAHDGGLALGDWHELERVRTWARSIASELRPAAVRHATAATREPAPRTGARDRGDHPTVVTR